MSTPEERIEAAEATRAQRQAEIDEKIRQRKEAKKVADEIQRAKERVEYAKQRAEELRTVTLRAMSKAGEWDARLHAVFLRLKILGERRLTEEEYKEAELLASELADEFRCVHGEFVGKEWWGLW